MKPTTPKPTQRHKRAFLTEDMEIRAKEISQDQEKSRQFLIRAGLLTSSDH
ncbi:MAG: hypothetical protein XD36_3174 [Halomonas sp. 54_146]|nr:MULTISPECIES: hypothetical protein [unclassified Halomonas]KUJ86400.1 MAG: hypothetical protein XD36_3174 [Halomonas sp. 54_146]